MQKMKPETETPINFYLSRFSKLCPGLHFLKNGNLDTHSVKICALKKKKYGHTQGNLDGQNC